MVKLVIVSVFKIRLISNRYYKRNYNPVFIDLQLKYINSNILEVY